MRQAAFVLIYGLLFAFPANAQTPFDATDPKVTERPRLEPGGGPLPEYPPSALRALQEGSSGFDLCIDANGRVTSQTLARSSGHAVLDKAAGDWMSRARFVPAKSDGVAIAVCKYRLAYEWKIDPATKTMNYCRIHLLAEADRPRLLAAAPSPDYPAKALADRAEGKVKVSLCIDAAGKVQTIALLTPDRHDSLELATGRWAAAGSYAPGNKYGTPVGVCGVEVEYDWKLPQ